MRGRRSDGCLGCGKSMPCGRNDLGGEQNRGPEHERMTTASKPTLIRMALCEILPSADLPRKGGKADALWEQTSKCTMGTAGVRVCDE